MESLTQQNIVFRKEDITMMSFRGVNSELGHKGQNYSLFKYKGGVNCHHHWELRVYKKKVTEDTLVSEAEAVKDGFEAPDNPSEVGIAPKDMANRGHHPNYKK